MTDRLIACVLGGNAPGAKVEVHDLGFGVGTDLASIHEQLLDGWFGDPQGLHVDAWTVLDRVAGYRVALQRTPADNGPHLYFVNIGGYRRGEFGERHAWGFFGAASKTEAKASARQVLLQGHEQTHKDNLHEVDDCLHIGTLDGWYVRLTPDANATDPEVTNGYFPLPLATIQAWIRKLPA